jgi:V-type H+-transporting ATPase subunit a
MKMSVIVGVMQMSFGILLKIGNFIKKGHWSLVVAVGVPEITFMMSTFGYLVFLVFLKWDTNYGVSVGGAGPECFANCPCPWTGYGSLENFSQQKPVSRQPPGIVNSMLAMFGIPSFSPGDPGDCWLWLFAGQKGLQMCLLVLAVIAVPMLLFTEPCLIKAEHERHLEEAQHNMHDNNDDEEAEEFSMGDVFVHQAIHTIEFVLGCVSNTASYLRLWALSLAHSQLSEVFWEYILVGFEMGFMGYFPGMAGGAPMLILCFAIFWACTMAVLMGMESLSAFLHALRLQWVEFQNKFYSADGHKFSPLTFDQASGSAED